MNLLESRCNEPRWSLSGRSYTRSPASSMGGDWLSFIRTPASSFGGDRPSYSSSNSAAVTFSLAVIACLLIFIQTWEQTADMAAAMGPHWTAGEVTRDAALEQLVVRKEQELEVLRTELQTTLSSNAMKEGSMHAQETSIKLLQERTEKQRVARSKAQAALSERQQQSSKCMSDVELLERELKLCTQEVAKTRPPKR